jgi:hypothetical protein
VKDGKNPLNRKANTLPLSPDSAKIGWWIKGDYRVRQGKTMVPEAMTHWMILDCDGVEITPGIPTGGHESQNRVSL